MDMLPLAIRSQLPLLYLRTDDIINVEDVLTFIAGEPVKPLAIPEIISKVSELNVPQGRVFFTSVDCKSLVKLYHFCVDKGLTIIFVNTERSVLQFDAGTLFPPKELVREFLSEISDSPDDLLPSFGGLTLKDISEVAKMTQTRDEEMTPRGVSVTRRGYTKLKGITQVDTDLPYYVCPSYLSGWLKKNTSFFTNPSHPSLIPRGLLFDGTPGTGKTLASKYIASAFGVPLYRLDLGSMMGKYVGESEASLNSALAQIDQVEPCVVIFDEIEKVFQSTGDSGVTSRMLSQLLWWLQEHSGRIFTVMTTNNIGKIPEELYREGRIDATMEFNGIETLKEGEEFASGAFTNMAHQTKLSEKPDFDMAKSLEALKKRLKPLFSDGSVPQVKLTQVTFDLVKEIISKGE